MKYDQAKATEIVRKHLQAMIAELNAEAGLNVELGGGQLDENHKITTTFRFGRTWTPKRHPRHEEIESCGIMGEVSVGPKHSVLA